ncbi:MAG TPA: SDR family oxidoreductase [Kofleriaceae bacterium]
MAQDLVGKNFIITGASAGIGKVTALELSRRGAHVIMANRSRAKSESVIAEIEKATGNRPDLVELDLSDLASVRRAAEAILAKNLPIHGLINNAGLAGSHGLTKDGFELTFGTNHLGPYLFTRLLLDKIKQTSGARIVNVSSHSHYQAKQLHFDRVKGQTRSRTGLKEYEESKLANVLFTKSLAEKLSGSGVTAYAVHPGMVATEIWSKSDLFPKLPLPIRWVWKKLMRTVEQGAVSSLRTATDPELGQESGNYYGQNGFKKKPSPLADDTKLAHELWQRSAEWTGLPA